VPLKASPEDQALLLDLQAEDTKLAQLTHRAKSLPELASLQALSVEEAEAKRLHTERQNALDDTNAELKRTESDVSVVETRIARDSERLQSSSSVKDVAALEQELTALKKRQSDLEEIELTVMERAEEQQAELTTSIEALDVLLERRTALEADRDRALAEIEGDRTAAATAREGLASRIPADLIELYEKQRARYGTGASFLQGGVSSASGVRLNESDMQVIRAAEPDDVLLCPDSSAILVRTGESGL
jgi:predicted  nucleic acid-binding Zn-ribbon protein